MIVPDEILKFKFDDVYHGFAECTGLLKLKEDCIFIEYIVKDSILGVIKSNVKSFEISYKNIIEAELINKLFTKKLIIKLKSLAGLQDFPAGDIGEISIQLKRDGNSLSIAQSMFSFINLKVAELKLAQYDY
jgi:hypothetical protein